MMEKNFVQQYTQLHIENVNDLVNDTNILHKRSCCIIYIVYTLRKYPKLVLENDSNYLSIN